MVSPTVINPSGEIGGGISSPKQMYTFFMLQQCGKYFDALQNYNNKPDGNKSTFNIEAATAGLIAFCPNTAKRKALWVGYVNDKKTDGELSASILAIGSLIEYLTDALEFDEQSTAGLM